MNALATTTTFSPSSFQLKLVLNGRKPPLVIARTRLPKLDRHRLSCVSVVGRSSTVIGSGRRYGRSLRIKSSYSADDFSGWANADEEIENGDSNRKQSFVGVLVAGAAGIVLVAGLTFAALSIGNRSTSIKKEIEPLTPQQENSLSDDNHEEADEDEKSLEKLVMVESGEETKTNTDDDGNGNGDFTNNTSIPNTDESESAASDKPPDNTDDFLPMPSTQTKHVSIVSEDLSEPELENLSEGKFLDSSAPSFDADKKQLMPDHPDGSNSLNEMESSNLSGDHSYDGSSIENIQLKLPSDVVLESNTIHEQFMESDSLVSMTRVDEIQELSTVHTDPSEIFPVSVDRLDISPNGDFLIGTASSGALPNEQSENDYNDMNVSRSLFDSTQTGNVFTSTGIPVPSLVSAALQAPPGKVLVPAVVDQLQSQALSALQVLKVIEDEVQPGDLCSRREYARWLVLASSVLSRTITSKVYPAMYIENVFELAFDDITPEDPDFPSIQGLAEAGLIASKLSRCDTQLSLDEDSSPFFFSPESPLSRQDLISWKMALEKKQLPVVDRQTLQQVSGFIDIDKIDPDAWPSLVADLAAGEQGITTLAFGYTRLFQPEKPVTKAQAAIALSTGDASAMVSEELARIEAESMAEKAVAAHSALVSEVERDLNASYEKELFLEKEKIDAVEKMAKEARQEVDKLRAEREGQNLSLMKERAAVDLEMEVFSRLRREVEEQLQTIMTEKVEISYEKERMNKLRRDAETENQEISRLQYELEVERKALSMARSWAEDEAKRAREKAKALEEARERWESRGIKVVVDDDLRAEETNAGGTWLAAGKQFSVEETVERSEGLVEKLQTMANEFKGKCRDTINRIIEKIMFLISNLKEKFVELKDSAGLRVKNSLHGAQERSAELTGGVKVGVKRVAGDWKEGFERLSQKFKA